MLSLAGAICTRELRELKRFLGKGESAESYVWLVIHEGAVIVDVRGRRLLLRAGQLVILRDGENPLVTASGGVQSTAIRTRGYAAACYTRYLREKFGWWHLLAVENGLFESAKAIPGELTQAETDVGALARTAFAWLATVHDVFLRERPPLRRIFAIGAHDYQALTPYVRYTLAELAAGFGISATQLGMKLRAHWGESPRQVLLRARMRLAGRLLLEAEAPTIQEVAWQTGYRSPPAFSAAFLEYYGKTPSEWRTLSDATLREPAQVDSPAAVPLPRKQTAHAKEGLMLDAFYASGKDVASFSKPNASDSDGPLFRIICCGLRDALPRSPTGLSFNAIGERHLSVVYTLEGDGYFNCGRQRIKLEPHTLIAYPQPIPAELSQDPGKPWRHFFINFQGAMAEGYFRHLVDRHGTFLKLPPENRLTRLAEDLDARTRAGELRSSLEWSRDGFQFLDAWEASAKEKQTQRLPLRFDPWSLEGSIVDRMPRSVTEMAHMLGYSRQHATRVLVEQWQHSPSMGLRLIKLDRAAASLRTGESAVSEVAREFGYTSTGGFIRAFKRTFGLTPLAYRQQSR